MGKGLENREKFENMKKLLILPFECDGKFNNNSQNVFA
jgi:hypothetical protein